MSSETLKHTPVYRLNNNILNFFTPNVQNSFF